MEWSGIFTGLVLSVGTLWCASETSAQVVDPSPLVHGVESIWIKGSPGPILAMRPEVVPVVAGDEDTSFPSLVVVATGWGQGRIVACGHTGFLENEAVGQYDNRLFAFNIMDWLDKTRRRRILVTQGHREWFGGDNFNTLQASLQQRGYTSVRSYGRLDATAVARIGVVIIGVAWGEFTPNEIAVLQSFVNSGGGLLLLGLGWSWEPYNPGHTLNDYPVNVIGEKYGIRWIDGSITDPTNAREGSPVFHTFYPNTGIQSIFQAFDCMNATLAAYPNRLVQALQDPTQQETRLDFLRSLLLLKSITSDRNTLTSQRQEIYDFYAAMMVTYPQYFAKSIVYAPKTQNVMAWVREGVYRSLVDALPLTPERLAEIAGLMGLTGRYLDLWNEFSVLLLDNTSLNSRQRDFVYNCLKLTPAGLHNLRAMSVVDKLGAATTPALPLSGLEDSVNVFGVDIGGYSENSFPADVAPGIVDGFSIVVAHELNHVVNAYYIGGHAALKQRHDALIAAAGTNPMNYLRSMFDAGFFVQAPQEFFASISNEWFTDSAKTVELGIVRLRNGIRHPMEQALFFADIYSMGGSTTYFYTTDASGNISRYPVSLVRNSSGNITVLRTGQTRYDFEWGLQAQVVKATRTSVPPAAPSTPGPLVEPFENGFGDLGWTFDGPSPWTTTSSWNHTGTYSAQAGIIRDGEQTSLAIQLDCQAGQISFWRKISSEPMCDFLEFFIDGQRKAQWSGELDWQEVSFPVQTGRRAFTWTYSKNGSFLRGEDSAWIDDITFPAK